MNNDPVFIVHNYIVFIRMPNMATNKWHDPVLAI